MSPEIAYGELIVRRDGVAGIVSLNRPRAIHALTAGMNRAMTNALIAWRDDPAVTVVLIDHAEGRGFCSGGDINLLRNSALHDNGLSGRRFFYEEYQLNHLLFSYDKPVVSFMDGITMGGGVGIALPARYRVATENTRLAMPETGIGLFPDVGGGWYLSRLPGRIGQFLALTGARIDGAECLWAGLATHYLPAERLAQAKAQIAQGDDIGSVLGALSVAPPAAKIAVHAQAIARHFAADRVEIVIRDQGAGFDRSRLAHAASADDPLAHMGVREKLGLREGGFGLLITDGMVDEMRHNASGNEVTLIKRFHLESKGLERK